MLLCRTEFPLDTCVAELSLCYAKTVTRILSTEPSASGDAKSSYDP